MVCVLDPYFLLTYILEESYEFLMNNMLIQNRIAIVNVLEKIDLGDQLRHFLAIFESHAAR